MLRVGFIRFFQQFQGFFHVLFSFPVVAFHIEYPSVGVEIGRVVGFGGDGFGWHFQGLVQVLAFHGEIIGVVVENQHIVGVVAQGALVGIEGFLLVALLVVEVAKESVEVG